MGVVGREKKLAIVGDCTLGKRKKKKKKKKRFTGSCEWESAHCTCVKRSTAEIWTNTMTLGPFSLLSI